MAEEFDGINYHFVKSLTDLTNEIEEILKSEKTKGKIETKKDKKVLEFDKKEDIIEIIFEKQTFTIDKNPICFYDEDDKCLFKIYDKSDEFHIKSIFDIICLHYDCFLPDGNIIPISDIISKGEKKIILIDKSESYEKEFKPLCKTLPIEGNIIDINTSSLLPIKSESLLLDINSEFNLIIKQRIPLINRLKDFVKNKNNKILKIYGSDGIGKSITFLYFRTINFEPEMDYKIIYFNLKDIFKYKVNISSYFRGALMQFYSRKNYFSLEKNTTSNDEDINKFNYKIYLNQIRKFNYSLKYHKIPNTFWEIFSHFFEFIKNEYHALIIIDQFKREYDELDKLSSILGNDNYKSHKFIIASSLNDNKVKEDLIKDLKLILKGEPKKNLIITNENDMEFDLFKDFNIEEIKEENMNDDFLKISLFNEEPKIGNNDKGINEKKINENINNINKGEDEKEEEKEDEDEEEEKIENLNDNKGKRETKNYIKFTSFNKIKNMEIIFVNNLISLKQFLEKNDKKILKLFNYNPKSFIKYKNFSNKNSILQSENLNINFLNSIYLDIAEKIDIFFKNLKDRKFNNYSSESLKGTYLIKLIDIIRQKKSLNLSELIECLEIFPFKYLKIFIEGINSSNENDIITLDELLNGKKFFLDFSYDFVETAFSKILYFIPATCSININELSGSAIGSFVESKIKKYIENKNYEIRYFWNFTSQSKSKEDNINKKILYDYKNYKEIKFDDIIPNKITEFDRYYYIVPGSQTNRSLDAIILKPNISKTFDIVSLQITKRKPKLKTKQKYIDDTFLAKTKIESNYQIVIENVYFYFILVDDYPDKETVKNLELENIAYLFYSIKNEQFLKNGYNFELEDIYREEAKINNICEDNEYKNFNSKNNLIQYMENFLNKKRYADKKLKISENIFNAARKHLFKLTPNIYLNKEIKDFMTSIVKKNREIFSSSHFTFQFVYNISYSEYYLLKEEKNLIGILVEPIKVEEKDDKIYHFLYMGKFHNMTKSLSNSTLEKLVNNKKLGRITKTKECYTINEIPNSLCEQIFVFKIYEI